MCILPSAGNRKGPVAQATDSSAQPTQPLERLSYDKILLTILDSNPYLSDGSRQVGVHRHCLTKNNDSHPCCCLQLARTAVPSSQHCTVPTAGTSLCGMRAPWPLQVLMGCVVTVACCLSGIEARAVVRQQCSSLRLRGLRNLFSCCASLRDRQLSKVWCCVSVLGWFCPLAAPCRRSAQQQTLQRSTTAS